MNRAPGRSDSWRSRHQEGCGGWFTKIAEPELSGEQVMRLSGLERAGRQEGKIDRWVLKVKREAPEGEADSNVTVRCASKRTWAEVSEVAVAKKPKKMVACPICDEDVAADGINDHIDHLHPP